MQITEALAQIQNAVYGREVRQAIHDGIKRAYDDAAQNGNSNMEVNLARGSFDTLNDRLDDMANASKYLSANLSNKITRGNNEVTFSDLSQEVKEALTDGSVAVVGTSSVSDINMSLNAASAYEIQEIKKNKNLFNRDRFTKGFVLSAQDGYSVTPNDGVGYSDFIRIESGSTLYKNKQGSIIFYDENKNRLSESRGMGTEPGVFETPSNAHYIRINVLLQDEYSYQIEYGTKETPYEPGSFELDKSIKVNGSSIYGLNGIKMDDDSLPLSKIKNIETSTNILNPNNIVENTYVHRGTGVLIENSSNYSFDSVIINSFNEYLRIKPVSHGSVNYAFYDVENNYISGGQILPNSNDWVISIPSQALYLSVSFASTENKPMVSYGTDEKSYEPFYQYIKDIVYPDEGAGGDGIAGKNHLMNKRIVCFGDSLTGAASSPDDYPSQIARRTGADVYNVGFNGTKLSTDETQTQHDAFSLVQITDAILTGDWTIQDREIETNNNWPAKLETLKSLDFNEIDVVTILSGTNDYGSVKSELDNENNLFDRKTILGAARYVVRELLKAYPHLQIVLMTPLFRTSGDGYSDDTVGRIGVMMSEIIDGLESVSNFHHVPFINLHDNLGINRYNHELYYLDGLHPNPKGRELLGDRIASQLLSKL